MKPLVILACVSVLLALFALAVLATVPLFTTSPIEYCGHRPVYRRCPWSPKGYTP